MIIFDHSLGEDRANDYRMDTQGFDLREAIKTAMIYEYDPTTHHLNGKYPLNEAPDWVYRSAVENLVELYEVK